jgi:hypothetical protein
MWIMGGDCIQGRYQPDVWSSRDGVAWECATARAPWGDRILHMSAAFGGAQLGSYPIVTLQLGLYPIVTLQLGLYPIVTLQYRSTTKYPISYPSYSVAVFLK